MTETITICPYCQEEKGNKTSCCGEVEFVEIPAEEDDSEFLIVYH